MSDPPLEGSFSAGGATVGREIEMDFKFNAAGLVGTDALGVEEGMGELLMKSVESWGYLRKVELFQVCLGRIIVRFAVLSLPHALVRYWKQIREGPK